MSDLSSSDIMSSSATSSFVLPDVSRTSSPGADDDVDSLSSLSTSILDSESDLSDAQREWETSLEQLQLLLTMIVMPFAGKFLGRKFAYWSWARYMEWMHNVEIRWTNKKAFNAAGAAEAAASL
ncbi:uncharacterized protein B0H64DRAFT_37197 [Chaetomium fimeti]|jgi:hypothetical protein|uniref:Uncharacterized protein n=1 Tax=Chaetomium fimeti TaxID=1854472 RepID=A0AAE0LXU1_9PEZI|nr:hypothetical protein B0H64DRAFT_37197 [Chaetomium fimeti]